MALTTDDIDLLLDTEIATGFTVRDALVAALVSGVGDVDKARDGDAQNGELTYTLPGSGLDPIVFDLDDVDRPTYRHRQS